MPLRLPYCWHKLSAAVRSLGKRRQMTMSVDGSESIFMSLEDIGVGQRSTWSGASSSTATPSITPPGDLPGEKTDDDSHEDCLIADFGPAGRMRYIASTVSGVGHHFITSNLHHDAEDRRLDPQVMLDCRVNERGLERRVIYDPHEIAVRLQPLLKDTSIAIVCLARLLEAALSRPGSEALLIAKAVTDAYLVNVRRFQQDPRAVDGSEPWDEFLLIALRCTWQHALEYRTDDLNEPQSASNLYVTASWFHAWGATDDTSGGGEPTIETFGLQHLLPGDWVWVLDHLDITGAPEGLHLAEEIELERLEEKELGLPRESWKLEEIRSALRNVSDDEWFADSGGMLNIRVNGPQRASTFRKVLAEVPGAIYGCLKDHAGVSSTPPTFRVYTTGDIFDALGEKVMVRSREVVRDSPLREERTNGEYTNTDTKNLQSSGSPNRRQVASLVEVQVTWMAGYTHVLGWLDVIDV